MTETRAGGDLEASWRRLVGTLRGVDGAVVAFSGGVDSSLLLLAAREALGDRVLAVTARSPTYPPDEADEARRIAALAGARHRFIDTEEMADPAFRGNPPTRCYACKRELFARLRGIAAEERLEAVLDGSNVDDEGDFRPGRRAAQEQGVRSPLLEAGLTKADVRALARARGLPNWDRPAQACLASRVPYGEELTPERLARVARAEAAVRALGFAVVRVRDHGRVARIEVAPGEVARLLESGVRERVVGALKDAGYTWVAADLEGYRVGAMNEGLGGKGSGGGER
jgi:uncharacterized protein